MNDADDEVMRSSAPAVAKLVKQAWEASGSFSTEDFRSTNNSLPQPSTFGNPLDTVLRNRVLEEPVGPGTLGSLDHFEISQLLGAGGMGIVLLARDTRNGSEVALKLPKPGLTAYPPALQRFLGEARHMQKLVHPHIISVLEIHEDPKRPYFVMPFCRRGSLAQLIKGGNPLEPGLVLKLGRQIAEALAFAHRKGIIHCDLKPGNVLMNEAGDACLTDFGLARSILNDAWAMVEEGDGVGTAPYLSPAMAAGEVEDTRCDIYSFGALLYEMLTGHPPYAGKTAKEIREQIRAGPPRPLREVQPLAPAGLAFIAETAMSRELRDRYAHMSDVLADLDRIAKVEQFQRKHRTEAVTFLFTGLVGSTEMKHQLGDRPAAERLLQHDALVREILQRFPEGEEIQTAGDSFLLVFAKSSEAVRFSLLLQARWRQLNREARAPVQDRVGILGGEVVLCDPDSETPPHGFNGWAVDACARVMSLAKGGQILMTRAVFDSARQVLKGPDLEGLTQLAWLSHGPYLLKGVEEPVEICEVGEVGHGPLSAPMTSEKAQRHVSADSEPVLGWRPAIGQVVPNTQWVLEQKLGEGGVGEVWLGRHSTLKEQRVFKFCFQANRVRSLKREVTLFRLLKERIGSHPNIVGVQEVFFDEAPYYVMMDYAAGKDLKVWCEEQGGAKNVPLEVRLEIVSQVADALQAAHDAGVIHRDVKPGNILVCDGSGDVRPQQSSAPVSEARKSEHSESPFQTEISPVERGRENLLAADLRTRPKVQVKLTDFGIGQVLSQECLAGITRAGFTETVLADSSSSKTGTQIYMAPELLAGKPASIRSDIYTLGVVLYQFLVGDFSRPLTTDWAKIIDDPLLREDLERCFAGNPQERFAGAAQLATNLRSWQQRHDRLIEEGRLKAERERLLAEQERQKQMAFRRRRIAMVSLASAIVLAVVALALGIAFRDSQAERQRAETYLYAADLSLAYRALEDNNFGLASRLMANYAGHSASAKRIPGWEWRYLWERCRSDESMTIQGHTNGVQGLAFSPDGTFLASGGWDGKVQIFNLDSRTVITNLAFESPVTTVAFLPDGHDLLTGSWKWGRGLEMWDTRTWQKTGFINNEDFVFSLALSSDGRKIALSGKHTVGVWDLDRRQDIIILEVDTSSQFDGSVALSPEGRLLVYIRPNAVVLQAIGGLEPEKVIETNNCNCLAFSPHGDLIALGNETGVVTVWNSADLKRVATLTAHVKSVTCLAFSHNGSLLATCGLDQRILLWNTASWQQVGFLKGHRHSIWNIKFSPDDKVLATSDSHGSVKLWHLDAKRESIPFLPYPVDLFDYMHRRAYPCLYGNSFMLAFSNMTYGVFEKSSLRETSHEIIPLQDFIGGTISRDGKVLALTGQGGTVGLWRVEDMKEIRQLEPRETNWGSVLRFSPDGTRLAGVRSHDLVKVWDLSQGGKTLLLKTQGGGTIQTLAFSADSRLLAATHWGGGISIWDVKEGKQLGVLRGHRVGVRDARFSPDMRFLASAGADSTARLWSVKSMAEVSLFEVVTGTALAVDFSIDGRLLAVGDSEGYISFWRTDSKRNAGAVRTAGSRVEWLEFLPDGNTLVYATSQSMSLIRPPSFDEIEAAEKNKAQFPLTPKSN